MTSGLWQREACPVADLKRGFRCANRLRGVLSFLPVQQSNGQLWVNFYIPIFLFGSGRQEIFQADLKKAF